jgi:TonB family protein
MIRYFLLANLYASLLFVLYALFLKNGNNQKWSRFYLLSCILISIALPFVKLDLALANNGTIITEAQLLPDVMLTSNPLNSNEQNIDWILWTYISGVVLMSGYFLYRILRLSIFLKKQNFRDVNGYRIALNTGIGPASLGNKILFPDDDVTPEILKHELAHLRSKHHYDKLFLNMLRCFFFPVVVFYFIQKELETVHEFEADALAADDQEQYVGLLLNQHFHTQQFNLLQSFFNHPIKRRIMMLYRKKATNNKSRGATIIFSAALAVSGIVFQSQTNLMAQDKTKKDKAASSDAKKITRESIKEAGSENLYYQEKQGQKMAIVSPQAQSPEREVFTSVEQMPEFPGGQGVLMKYLSNSIRYPESARKANIQGRVIAQFVVNQVGKIERIEIKRGLSPECDAETVRVIKAMPAWKPAKLNGRNVSVYYTLPISFRLSN